MAKTLLLLFCSLGLLSCYEGNAESDVNQIACTQIASDNALIINIISSTSIPSHLVLSINGDDIDIDECEEESFHSMRFSEDRKNVIIYYSLNSSAKDYHYYFDDIVEGELPLNTSLRIKTFNRTNCSGAIGNGSVPEDLSLVWRPAYANGEQCGVTSYTASAQLRK